MRRTKCATFSEVRTTPAGEIVLVPSREDLHAPIFLTPKKAIDLVHQINAGVREVLDVDWYFSNPNRPTNNNNTAN